MCLIRPIVDISHKIIKRIKKLSMEISGSVPSTHSQATSSSVIVQSNQSTEDSVVLSSLSDIHQLHQQHQHQQQQQQSQQTTAASATHAKHLQQPPQSSTSFLGTPRTSSSIQQASSSSAASSPLLSPPGKTFGRNNNGTSKFEANTIYFSLFLALSRIRIPLISDNCTDTELKGKKSLRSASDIVHYVIPQERQINPAA